MLYITHGTTSLVEGIDIDGVFVILLVDLEAQVSAENIVEV